MNKKYGAIGCLAILVVAASLGPQVDTDISINKLELPDDLDLYLAESESHFNDITEGTEKTIIWEGEPGEKTLHFDCLTPRFLCYQAGIISPGRYYRRVSQC
jgi:hypothetical protein